jgi:ubiquinol-cytochrome c reductase cytochrome b subunit
VLLGLVVAHILALHDVGSNNPDGVEIKDKRDPETGHPLDGIPFHPYYTVHDLFGLSMFLLAFFAIMFLTPELAGYFLEWNNFIPADPLTTPPHIAPVWYFTPYYSVLRATTEDFMWVLAAGIAAYAILLFLALQRPAARYATLLVALVLVALMIGGPLKLDPKFWGVVLMGVSVLIFFALPWIDRAPVKSMRYRPLWHMGVLLGFVLVFFILGFLGTQQPTPTSTYVAQGCTLLYFAFFLLMPWWSRAGEFKPVPDRVLFTAH